MADVITAKPAVTVSGECELAIDKGLLGKRFKLFAFQQTDGIVRYVERLDGRPVGTIDLITCMGITCVGDQLSLRMPNMKLLLRPGDAGTLARWGHCLTLWVSFLRQSPLIRLEAAPDAATLRPGVYHSWGYKKLFADDWDQLYFKLQDKSLQYFRDEAAADPLGFLDVRSVVSVAMGGTEQSHVVVKLALKTGAVWTLGFDNKHLAEEWRVRLVPASGGATVTPSLSKRFLTTLAAPIAQARGAGEARRATEAPPPLSVSEPFNVGNNRVAVDQLLEQSRSSQDGGDDDNMYDSSVTMEMPEQGMETDSILRQPSVNNVYVDTSGRVVPLAEHMHEMLDAFDGADPHATTDDIDASDEEFAHLTSDLSDLIHFSAESFYDESSAMSRSSYGMVSSDSSLASLRSRLDTVSFRDNSGILQAAMASAIDRHAKRTANTENRDRLIIERTRAAQLLRQGLEQLSVTPSSPAALRTAPTDTASGSDDGGDGAAEDDAAVDYSAMDTLPKLPSWAPPRSNTRAFQDYQNLKHETWRRYGPAVTLGEAPSPVSVRRSNNAVAGPSSPKPAAKWAARQPKKSAPSPGALLSASAPQSLSLAPPIPPKPKVNIHTLRKPHALIVESRTSVADSEIDPYADAPPPTIEAPQPVAMSSSRHSDVAPLHVDDDEVGGDYVAHVTQFLANADAEGTLAENDDDNADTAELMY